MGEGDGGSVPFIYNLRDQVCLGSRSGSFSDADMHCSLLFHQLLHCRSSRWFIMLYSSYAVGWVGLDRDF